MITLKKILKSQINFQYVDLNSQQYNILVTFNLVVGSKLGAEGTREFQQAKFQPKSRIIIYGGFSMIEAKILGKASAEPLSEWQ